MVAPINLPQVAFPAVQEESLTFDPAWYRVIVNIVTRLGGSVGLAQVAGFTVAGKPPANANNLGSMIYITTTSKPAWSDGSVWRYADGTLV